MSEGGNDFALITNIPSRIRDCFEENQLEKEVLSLSVKRKIMALAFQISISLINP